MEQQLTTEIIMVMSVIGLAVILFVTEIVRVDVVAIIIMVLLPFLGLTTPQEAFSGFASNAVISIIAVIIVGAALDKTGIMNKVASPIVKFAGESLPKLTFGISGTVAIISSFMQNIGAAALFMPATARISKKANIPLSRLLMPMGFCAILGGTITLVGSSPLILLNDLLGNAGLEKFGLFSVTPVGLLLVLAGIVYFVLLGHIILPDKKGASGANLGGALFALKKYGNTSNKFELSVPEHFKHTGTTLEEMGIRKFFMLTVIAVKSKSYDKVITSPKRDTRLSTGDTIAVVGELPHVKRFAEKYGLVLKSEISVFEEELSENNSGFLEGIVPPDSHIANHTLREQSLALNLGLSPTALYRSGKVFRAGFSDMPIETGDAILLYGKWSDFAKLKNSSELLLPADSIPEVFEVWKAKRAIIVFFITLAMIFSQGALKTYLGIEISLSVCLMTGALLMVLSNVLSIDEAYKSVDWRTVFLLAGLIPLGLATQKSHTADYVAELVLSGLGDVSPLVLLTVIGIITTVFTLVISNVGATVLLVPWAISIAIKIGADPRMAAMVVGLAASNTFVLPTHQVNAFIMGPGRYSTMDFVRAGGGMTAIFILVTVFSLWFFYGI